MMPIVPPPTEYRFAEETFGRRVIGDLDESLGRDALRPDPIAMALRRGFGAIARLFRRDDEKLTQEALIDTLGTAMVWMPKRTDHHSDRDLAA